MDNLTHSLVGALLGQAGLKRKTGLAMPALIIGANLPDIDIGCFLWLDGVEHLGFRRGITHGPIAWLVLPLLLAGGLWWFDRWQERRGQRRFGRPEGRLPVSFKWLFLLGFVACLTHPALDWLNVYGIRLLEPFSHRWFYGDTLFIIDVWLWAIMLVGLWLSLGREKRGGNWQRPARMAMAVGLVYVGVNWAITANYYDYYRYQESGPTIVSPMPVIFFKREILTERYENLWDSTQWNGGQTTFCFDKCPGFPDAPVCKLDPVKALRRENRQLDAFLFWSRAPFAERAPDGSVLLRDARFYDPRVRDRFTVALPQVKCEPLARDG